MKQLFTIAFVALCGVLFAQQDDWRTIDNNDYHIDFPQDWDADESGRMGTEFILFSPLSADDDQFKENVNLLIQDLSSYEYDLDKYTELSETQIEQMITDAEVITNERLKRDGLAFHHMVYSGKQSSFQLVFEQYYWVIDSKAYVLTFTSEQSQYEQYKAIGKRVLDSFRLK